MIRDVVVESIRAAGYAAEICSDGEEALRRNIENNYDLVVTDMRLPGMDGLSLMRRLKATPADTDVIVITGYGSIENAVECMRAGALDYLIKPFTADQIQLAVRRALEHRELRKRALELEFYRELSYVDALTGVYNRRYFDEALQREIKKAHIHGSSVILFIIDIDDFKLYNDKYGHQKGDEALTKFGAILKSVCRGYDIVTRYGGEEFAIVFPGASKEHAIELANRIKTEVREADFSGDNFLPKGRMTVSIGVACYPDDSDNAEDLIKCSDEALFRAKKLGKNRVELYKPAA